MSAAELVVPIDTLLAPLSAVIGTTERRHLAAILSHVLLEFEDGEVLLTATDQYLEVTSRSPLSVPREHQKQAFTVDAHRLRDILTRLPDDASLTLKPTENRLTIVCGASRFALKTLEARDFPVMGDSGEPAVTFEVPQAELKRALALTVFAIGIRDTRPYLNGAFLDVAGAVLTIVGCNGHHVSEAKAALGKPADAAAHVLLPGKAANELARLLKPVDEPVRVAMYRTRAVFEFGSVRLCSGLIDAEFPNWKRLMFEPNHFARLDRERLAQALGRVVVAVVNRNMGARWTLEAGRLQVLVKEGGEEAQEAIGCDYAGEPAELAFNSKYVLDALNVPSEAIECALSEEESKMLIRMPGRDDWTYLLMSMRM